MTNISILSNLPSGWDKESLANVIENISLLFQAEVSRDGKTLLFDYDSEKKMIMALKGFFVAYAPYSVGHVSEAMINDLKLKLLHESSHLFGYNERKASDFSIEVMKLLQVPGVVQMLETPLCQTVAKMRPMILLQGQ